MSNFDCRYFYKKWIEDIFGAQDKTSGYVPHTAPFRGGAGGPGWGSAIAIIPWRYYVYYKDKKFLKQALPYIEKWINYLKGRLNQKGLINGDDDTGWGLGDWCLPLGEDIEWSNPRDDLIKLPAELVNTCFFVYCIKIYNKILNVLNENGYCFSEELDCAVKAVNNEFLGECYGEGIQGSDAFALYMEIVPPEKKKAVVESLKKNIENNGYTFDTGIFGTGYTLYALAKNGLNHYAYKMLTNVRYPSYGYMHKMGATSVWETWEGTGSRVHSGLVCYDSWIIRELAGIKPAEDDAADYNISPFFEREISFLNVKLKTNNGKICVGWNREEKTVFRVSVPFNTTARVFCNNEIKICTKGDYEFIID